MKQANLSRSITLKAVLSGFVLAVILVQGAAAKDKSSKRAATPAAASASGPVDVNSASEKELDALPGIGPATAKKIIAARPYSSVSDLSRAGLRPTTIQKITPLVKVGAAPAMAPAPARSAPSTQSAVSQRTRASAPSATSTSTPAVTTAPAPGGGPGMVWVNKETKVYHRQGDRWYGNTKNGQYMTEADAIKAGYHASKQKSGTKQ